MINSDAKEIAMLLFPESWVANTSNQDFKLDNNAGRRHCAEAVAQHFLEVLKRDSTVSAVMHAFYRREHFKEPSSEEVMELSAKMGAALLAYELELKRRPPKEGCIHNYCLSVCDNCLDEVNTI